MQESKFDNRVTRMYRAAQNLSVPTKYLYYEKPNSSDSHDLSSMSAKRYIEENEDLELSQIYLYLRDKKLDINPIDLALLYCYTIISKRESILAEEIKSRCKEVCHSLGHKWNDDGTWDSIMELSEKSRNDGSHGEMLGYIKDKFKEMTLVDICNSILDNNSNMVLLEILSIYNIAVSDSKMEYVELIKKVNTFYEHMNVDPGRSKSSRSARIQLYKEDGLRFSRDNNTYGERYCNLFAKEKKKLEMYITNHTRLSKITPLQYEEPVIETSIIGYSIVKEKGDPVTIEDGEYIFSRVIPSFEVPFIQYNNSNGVVKVKVYHGSPEKNDIPDFEHITEIVKKNEKNCFYITLCSTKDPFGQPLKKKSYTKIAYMIKTGTLKIPSPSDEEGIFMMKERVKKVFPTIKLIDPVELSIRGFFIMQNLGIIDAALHYCFINNPLFRAYVFTYERKKARSERPCNRMNYNSPENDEEDDEDMGGYKKSPTSSSPVSLSFGEVKGANTTAFGKENKSSTIKVIIKKASNRAVLNEFIQIFTCLMAEYDTIKHGITSLFRSLIKDSCDKIRDNSANGESISKTSKKSRSKKSSGKTIISKNHNLRIAAPNVFMSQYCKQCACVNQPIIIPDDEVEQWQNLLVTKNGEKFKRIVADFPPRDPRNPSFKPLFKFVCPGEAFVVPHYKEQKSKILPNSKQYPFLPCCIGNASKAHAEVYWGMEDNSSRTTRKNYRVITSGPINNGNEAELSIGIINILKNSVERQKNPDLFRLGTQGGPNSIIHCVMEAKAYTNYSSCTHDEKEKLALLARKHIADTIHPMLYKQELFDKTLEEIQSNVLDATYPLDPFLFYRGLEEFFDVNIYVFRESGKNSVTGNIENKPFLEVPRSKIFHVRHARPERSNIIIYKSPNSGLANNQDFYYSIIVSNGDIKPSKDVGKKYGGVKSTDGMKRYIFGETMGLTLHRMMSTTINSYFWSFAENEGDEIFQTRNEPFNLISWEKILSQYSITGQRVDRFGRLRVVAFNKTYEDRDEVTIMISTPPCQPLNVRNIEQGLIRSVHYEVVEDIFGVPNMITANGFWYDIMKGEESIFVLCDGFNRERIDSDRIETIRDEGIVIVDPVVNIKSSRENSKILIDLIKWCWSLSGRESIKEWWPKYVYSTGSVRSKSTPHLINRLPMVSTTREALIELDNHRWWPDYFKRSGIYLPLPLFEKCKAYFLGYEKDFKDESYDTVKQICNIKHTDTDFIYNKDSVVFTDPKHLDDWLEYKKNESNYNFIHTSVTEDMASQVQPYLLKNRRHVYLVQNVRGGDFRKAALLLDTWFRTHINKGFEIESQEEWKVDYPYVIYGIAKNKDLVPIVDKTRQNPSYAEFLGYTFTTEGDLVVNGNIAAMIPLN
jgi:hypothetical protein